MLYYSRAGMEDDTVPPFCELNGAAITDYRSAKTFIKWAQNEAPEGARLRIVPLPQDAPDDGPCRIVKALPE